ncbi:MAG TPA: hypothetical protein VNW99_10280 [Cytophagaceae bacterium]|jgi:hypothetical protein|nr:hypothetical protein [Cytophagaceae bacterium]
MYYLDRQNIHLTANDGTLIILNITSNSGRIAYRDKINTLIGIKHPAIELGTDPFGYRWFIHHHYKNINPIIEREDLFSLGEKIFYDDRTVSYDQFEIVERALIAWSNNKEYNWLWQNCQHFINEIASDKHTSESVNQISDAVLFISALTGLAGLFTGNKALIATAAGLGLAGGTAKYLSNKNISEGKHVNRVKRTRKFLYPKVA